MQSKFQKIIFLLMILVMLFPVFSIIYAQTQDYTVLAPIPGVAPDNCMGDACKTTLEKYLPAAFNLAIGIAAALAFVMITWGGITYATSDALSGKAQGRQWIEDAIWGLVLVIGAWIILYTINPQILNFTLSLQRPKIEAATPTVTAGTPMTQAAIDESNANRIKLSIDSGGKINAYAGPCTQGQISGCVNLNGLPQNAITGLENLSKVCGNCIISITGGTEGGHATHGAGAPIVDLAPNTGLNAYLGVPSPTDGKIVEIAPKFPFAGATFTYEVLGGNTLGTSTGGHWHVVFH